MDMKTQLDERTYVYYVYYIYLKSFKIMKIYRLNFFFVLFRRFFYCVSIYMRARLTFWWPINRRVMEKERKKLIFVQLDNARARSLTSSRFIFMRCFKSLAITKEREICMHSLYYMMILKYADFVYRLLFDSYKESFIMICIYINNYFVRTCIAYRSVSLRREMSKLIDDENKHKSYG